MSSSYQVLTPARLHRDARGRPVSPEFGDIYYAGEAGAHPLAQARAVFLAGNGLPERWQGRRHFTVLETGFGLGLNFLALWQAWREDSRRSARLHMVSIEAHPFTRADLARALQALIGPQAPERVLVRALLREWPVLTPGLHRLVFAAGAVTLTLALGPVERLARQLELGFDAAFLDGFSPRVNPEMWTPQLFGQLARLANQDARMASWCSAGHVRRSLQDAGFLVSRETGFGAKRHRMVARLRPGMGRAVTASAPEDVIVVGAGFAGAAAAHALACRGHAVTVFDPALGQGSSGTHRHHRAAALAASLSRDDDVRTRLSRNGAELGARRWATLPPQARPWPCGLFEPVAPTEQVDWQAALARLSYPQDWVRWLDAPQAAARTGVAAMAAGIWHARAQLVRVEAFLAALLDTPGIVCRPHTVARLAREGEAGWAACAADGRVLARAAQVVLAAGAQVPALLRASEGPVVPPRVASLHRIAGQISYFAPLAGTGLRCMVAGDGLCLPDGEDGLIGGSTYVRDATLSIMMPQGHHEIQRKVATLLNVEPLHIGLRRSAPSGWAGWRAAARDRLPIIGPLRDVAGLWLACGFGSRGLAWSALAAELLTASLDHEPVPLERALVRKLMP